MLNKFNFLFSHPDNIQSVIVEMDLPSSLISLEPIDIPGVANPPMVYAGSHINDKITHPKHVEFGTSLSKQLTLGQSDEDQIILKAKKRLQATYPSALSYLIECDVVPPSVGGHLLSNTPDKYRCKLGAKLEGIEVEIIFLLN